MIARLSASYLAVFLIVLAALSAVAYTFFARSTHEMLEPLLALPEGQAAYAAAMRRVASTIVLFDLPLGVVVGIAAYGLARVSVQPLLAARRREERFAADAAHELRTPLATIAALAQAARETDPPAQTAALAKIADVALDASGLLGDLLTLARDGPADARLHEPVDVAAIVSAAVDAVGPSTATLSVTRAPTPNGAYVSGDARALRRLVDNLIENALRYARTSVAAGVRTEHRWIVLWVEDDGDGIAAADRERVFERFFKADPAASGSGLGLAICRHIATRHGGTITVEGRARFVARLPRAES